MEVHVPFSDVNGMNAGGLHESFLGRGNRTSKEALFQTSPHTDVELYLACYAQGSCSQSHWLAYL